MILQNIYSVFLTGEAEGCFLKQNHSGKINKSDKAQIKPLN